MESLLQYQHMLRPVRSNAHENVRSLTYRRRMQSLKPMIRQSPDRIHFPCIHFPPHNLRFSSCTAAMQRQLSMLLTMQWRHVHILSHRQQRQ
jgi:hypothetical protein